MALNKAQLKLLRLLKDRDTEQGVFFARWDEIRSAKYSDQWVKENQGAPDLNWDAERLLLELIEQGLVDELEKWGTKEGKHFRITRMGRQYLQEERRKKQAPNIICGFAKKHWPWVTGLIGLVCFLFLDLLEPTKTCGLMPEQIAAWLELCSKIAGED